LLLLIHQCVPEVGCQFSTSPFLDVRPTGPKPEARMAEDHGLKSLYKGAVLGEGHIPSPPAKEPGERCKLPMGARRSSWRPGDLVHFRALERVVSVYLLY